MSVRRASSWPPPGLWALVLGAVGFCTGFFGPIALNPDANQGPLLGIFITGPGGAAGGLVLGAVVGWLPISAARRWQALLGVAAVFGLGTLYFCLPSPATEGLLIEGKVARCQSPAELGGEAISYWEKRIASAPWAKVRDDWRNDLPRMLARETGVVLTVIVQRQNRIVKARKPWNRGRISAQGWQRETRTQRYFADFNGDNCADYAQSPFAVYMPYGQGSGVWPPNDLSNFLDLARVLPVPERFRSE